jgi:hypothetical protein
VWSNRFAAAVIRQQMIRSLIFKKSWNKCATSKDTFSCPRVVRDLPGGVNEYVKHVEVIKNGG